MSDWENYKDKWQKESSQKLIQVDEAQVLKIGQEFLGSSQKEAPGFFNKNFWTGKMMDWAMKKKDFKIEMFRFVDVLPQLQNSEQISDHIKTYFLQSGIELSPFVKSALGVASSGGLFSKIASNQIKKNVFAMAKNFIIGENAQDSLPQIKKMWKNGIAFTVDILGELVQSEKEADLYFEKYHDLIENLPSEVNQWANQKILTELPWGQTPRVNISVKASSLYSLMNPFSLEDSVQGVKSRLRVLLRNAVKNQVTLNIDMEQNDYREILFRSAEELFCEDEFINYEHFGFVIQAYLKDSQADILRMAALAEKRNQPIYVRLVKGAYWDFENIQASQKNWESPVFQQKESTDWSYERCTDLLLNAYPYLVPAFATHNMRSLSYALALAESKKIPSSGVEVQMLYGMAEPFKKITQSKGYRIREYTPVGAMLPGMAYLVRRLLENTSNEGFLKNKFVDLAETAVLLRKPENKEIPKTKKEGFRNLAPLDFTKSEVRKQRSESLLEVKKSFPRKVSPFIGADSYASETLTRLKVLNPCQNSEVISELQLSDLKITQDAVSKLKESSLTWRHLDHSQRVRCIEKLADLLEEKRYSLSALIVSEVAKDFAEADADLCEAVDFCRYYAEESRKLFSPQRLQKELLGEENSYFVSPKGLTAVISPWNFPLAILCGMCVAPLLCGNGVLLKPAEEASAVGQAFYELLLEAGVDSGAMAFLPGKGEIVGAELVRNPDIHMINFTGSREVGKNILSKVYSEEGAGRGHFKKVLAELGGKNALYVDYDADLDEAIHSILYSAFAFQGQKCSALSRLFLHEDIYEPMKKRLMETVSDLKVGDVFHPETKVSAVVTQESKNKLLSVIERNQKEIIFQKKIPVEFQNSGHFVPVTLFESSDLESELCTDEFFGPLLTLIRVKDHQAALTAMNAVDDALTGGVYSRNPEVIASFKKYAEVGNLYVNRSVTGAIVGRQPFGGYKLSGLGAKAGGPDYLTQFVELRTLSENNMRRGFSPDIGV